MRKLLALLLFAVSTNLWSAMIIETIKLLHRPADEVIPIVKPMLAPGASITGTGYKLIIKSTPENISQVQAVLEEIDINQNLLKVTVSMGNPIGGGNPTTGNSSSRQEQHGSVAIEAGTDKKTKIDARVYQTDRKNEDSTMQVMSVAEGYWARIAMGQSIPIAARTRNPDGTVTESITYQQIMTGYQVMPRTHDDKVTLTIRPISQSADNSGTIETNELETTITGKLGEWLFLGDTNQEENLRNSGINYRTRIRSTDVNQVWVKVERP